jgi:hypothetical protein
VILDVWKRSAESGTNRQPAHTIRILRSYESDEELVLNIVRHGRSQTLTGTVPEPGVELVEWRTPMSVEKD